MTFCENSELCNIPNEISVSTNSGVLQLTHSFRPSAKTQVLMLILLLGGCASFSPPAAPVATVAIPDAGGVPVYVVYNHFHSGLTVPSDAIRAHPGPTDSARAQLSPRPWTSLGYGDAKFYEGRGINPARVVDFFRSMLATGNPSVVHLDGISDPLSDPGHPHLLKITISRARFGELVRRVDQSFMLKDGAPEFLVNGSDGNDKFYRGQKPASAIHECNQWIGDVLGAAGVPHTYLLDTTSDGLAFDLQGSGHAIAVKPSA